MSLVCRMTLDLQNAQLGIPPYPLQAFLSHLAFHQRRVMCHPLVEPWEGAVDRGKPGASAALRALGHVVQDGAENVRGQMGHAVPLKGWDRGRGSHELCAFPKDLVWGLKGKSLCELACRFV